MRHAYRYAIGFRLTNVGDGPGTHVAVGFVAQEEMENAEASVYAEMVSRDVLLPGEPLEDSVGLRGRTQDEDPTDEQARAFFANCLAAAMCWDLKGRPYMFFPAGGGLASERRWWRPFAPKWIAPHEFFGALYQHPSRGEQPGAVGMGPLHEDR